MMSHNMPLEKIFAKAWSTTNSSELVNTGRFQISELLTSQFISVCSSVEIVSAAILLYVVHTSLWRDCSMLCFEQAQFIEGYSEEAYKY